jgi:hypothetical protein
MPQPLLHPDDIEARLYAICDVESMHADPYYRASVHMLAQYLNLTVGVLSDCFLSAATISDIVDSILARIKASQERAKALQALAERFFVSDPEGLVDVVVVAFD